MTNEKMQIRMGEMAAEIERLNAEREQLMTQVENIGDQLANAEIDIHSLTEQKPAYRVDYQYDEGHEDPELGGDLVLNQLDGRDYPVGTLLYAKPVPAQQVQNPVHWRALLSADEVVHEPNTDRHVVGFTKLSSAEKWIASKRDFEGRNYRLEPLYAASVPAMPMQDDLLLKAACALEGVCEFPDSENSAYDARRKAEDVAGEIASYLSARKSKAMPIPKQEPSPAVAGADDWQAVGGDYDKSIHSNPSADEWADFFIKTYPRLKHKRDIIQGWFANAMMAMHDSIKSPRITEQDAAVKAWGDAIASLSKGRANPHPDDVAVDRFAEAMKIKLAKSRDKGRGGWENPALCEVSDLAKMLIDHLPKGDPVDVANFAMMLCFREGGGAALSDAGRALLNKLNAKPELCELCESLDAWQKAEGTKCPAHTKPESVGG